MGGCRLLIEGRSRAGVSSCEKDDPARPAGTMLLSEARLAPLTEIEQTVGRALRHIATFLLAVALALVSSRVARTRLEIQDWDCPPAPASCARPVLVLGFPWPFISDYHGISPVGSASVVEAVLGIDHFHIGAFVLDAGFYFVCLAIIARVIAGRRAALGSPAARRADP